MDIGAIVQFSSPDVLTTTDNAFMQWAWFPVDVKIKSLRVVVKTAPTGAAITVDFKRGTVATGTVGASIGTVTVAIGGFSGQTLLSPNASLTTTEFLACEITAVGSVVAGSNMAAFADCY
jgi:hypothetical protein